MVSKQWVEGFNQQIFGGDSTQTISRENLLAGFVAGVIGKGIMTKAEAQTFMQTQMEAVQAKALEKNTLTTRLPVRSSSQKTRLKKAL